MDTKCNTGQFERHPHKNEPDPEIIRHYRINGTNVSKTKAGMVRKISIMESTDKETSLPRKLLKSWCMANQCKIRGAGNMTIRKSYHNDFKNMNIN